MDKVKRKGEHRRKGVVVGDERREVKVCLLVSVLGTFAMFALCSLKVHKTKNEHELSIF